MKHLTSGVNPLLTRIFESASHITRNDKSPNLQNFINKICNIVGVEININGKTLCDLLKIRFKQIWKKIINAPSSINRSGGNKLRTYCKFKSCFGMEYYLRCDLNSKFQKIIARLRLSAHKLRIETDRYNSKNAYIPPECRLCTNCDLGKVEDEFHFILECPKYDSDRLIFFNIISNECNNFCKLSQEDKFVWIMSNENKILIKQLGIYINNATSKKV